MIALIASRILAGGWVVTLRRMIRTSGRICQRAEVVIEGMILLHQDDDVGDFVQLAVVAATCHEPCYGEHRKRSQNPARTQLPAFHTCFFPSTHPPLVPVCLNREIFTYTKEISRESRKLPKKHNGVVDDMNNHRRQQPSSFLEEKRIGCAQ